VLPSYNVQDEVLYEYETSWIANITTKDQITLENPFVNDHSRGETCHYEEVVEKYFGNVGPHLFDHEFISLDDFVPKIFDEPIIAESKEDKGLLIPPFNDQIVKVIQAPLIEEENLVFPKPIFESKSHASTFESKYHAFEVSSQPIYDDYYDYEAC
jgi:hypothetical protein